MKIEYYKLVKVEYERPKGAIVTQAFHSCNLCGGVISTTGGPGEGVCVKCGDALNSQQLRGCVVWAEE